MFIVNFENDDQLRALLKKESKRLGVSIKNTYNTYFSRILLERISKMCYDKLYIKGSMSELAHLNTMIRPITDIDLVSTVYHNDPLMILYQAMYDTNGNLFFELSDIPKRTKTGIYKIHIVANFGKIKHPISIDFQELSKTIYEKDYKRIDPIFKGDNYFHIYTPSYEEHFAEKLCIVIESCKKEVLNTRVKDFYDIYKLSGGKYDKERLSYFFYHMLIDRNKVDINNLSIDFLNKEYINNHKNLWESMSKKYEFLDKEVLFDDSIELTKELLNKVNSSVKGKEGSIVYLDKSQKHMYELNNQVRLINVMDYPIDNCDEFLGFVCGIVSQDHDLEEMYLDSFLTIASLEEEGAITKAIEKLDIISEKFKVKFILSVSKNIEQLPECAKAKVIISL